MTRERKIRNLVESVNGENVTIDDVLKKLVEASGHARNLEYGSKKSDLKRTKKTTKESLDLLKAFYKRLREEVTTSVNDIAIEKNKNYRGNPDALPNSNQ